MASGRYDHNIGHSGDPQQRRLPPGQQPPAVQQYQAYSSPLPQTQWDRVPQPYRPLQWRASSENVLPTSHSAQQYSWRLQSPGAHERPFQNQPSSDQSRHKRRPSPLRRKFGRGGSDKDHYTDSTMQSPQRSPYENNSPNSLAVKEGFDHAPRSVSQPNTPSYNALHHRTEEPAFTMVPRAPTYPPAGRRRARSATITTDTMFGDAEEFHLFAQATAGLGPEQAFRHSHSSSDSSGHHSQRLSRDQGRPPLVSDTHDLVSPVMETPTTMTALQHLAQMPQASYVPSRAQQSSGGVFDRRISAAMAGFDVWLIPPSPDEGEGALGPIEDELPDYASSQAQAHAAQRVEAARRAQELRRRWEQSR